jgi:hypothetical protein
VSVREIIATHPQPSALDRELIVKCVEECLECGATCTSCADACLAEPDVQELVRCISLCLDCADACAATGRIVGRQTDSESAGLRAIVEACVAACDTSAEECERHAAHHEHCRICAETCRRCEQACRDLLERLR